MSSVKLFPFKLLILFFSVLLFSLVAFSQYPQGTLVGTVEDSHGARITGATVTVEAMELPFQRQTTSNDKGEFRIESLPPGNYRATIKATNFAQKVQQIKVSVASTPTLSVMLSPEGAKETVNVQEAGSLTAQPQETTSSVQKTVISQKDLANLPLAHRSFANIAYLAPMTQPVEPSDPTKARITAVSFGGSSGLNVDLSVDGGDNNDDYIGGFLQNYSVDAMEEFVVRTAQYDADTSRTNGGSIIIITRRGTDLWHGYLGYYFRGQALNARNKLDNPEPNPKQPFSRQNALWAIGGPIKKDKLWFFSTLEYVHENASIAYSALSLSEFKALAQLASSGQIPGVTSIDVPTSIPVPFRDSIFSTRVDWSQSSRSDWFFRGSFDINRTHNDLVQQAALPSAGAFTRANYYSFLVGNQYQYSSSWIGSLTLQYSSFDNTKDRNSHLGLSLAFPFSSNFHTTSGFETFGDNQFATPITAFPVKRDQQKYQVRYDLANSSGKHSPKFGINFIHEPVLSGRIADDAETLLQFQNDPSFYLSNPALFGPAVADCLNNGNSSAEIDCTQVPAGGGSFAQNVQRFGVYGQDSWRVRPNLTINYGLRYDTTFGLFNAFNRDQSHNPAVFTLNALNIPLAPGIPHDYRKAISPRFGIAYSPGSSGKTVIRGGVGMYYNDLTQNGWVDAFRSVEPIPGMLNPGDQGFVIDPNYHTPYAIQFSAGVERAFGDNWRLNVHYEHQQGVHQYRRYEYISGVTLPADAPNISLFRTDNRSRYDGVSVQVEHRFSGRFDLSAHYTLAKASTYGAVVGELFDFVNGVSDVRTPFGPGDFGPSGEDVRHRLVIAGTLELPGKFQFTTLSQFESARPFTIATPVDINGDGLDTNDRAVVNGAQTSLDAFRGTPFYQIDLRFSREFRVKDKFSIRPFVEFFNLLNRTNPGNNFVGDLSVLPVPAGELDDARHICLDQNCTTLKPITSLKDLRVPGGALGDFFGPGTTVGIPFAAQFGIRLSF